MLFTDRKDAGEKLAEALLKYKGGNTVIYALPRGGVTVGFEVAKALNAPLDLVIARKIGHPYNPEYAVCAVTEEGEMICNEAEKASLDPKWLENGIKRERGEAARRRKIYLGEKKHISAKGKTAIVVDDGIATGLTIMAALQSIKKDEPEKLIAAVPVSPHETVKTLRAIADDTVILEDAENYLGAVGAYYRSFPQVTDDEVIDLLSDDYNKQKL